MSEKIKNSTILTCKVVPESQPRRGSATTEGFNASAWSARLMVASPRMLDREEPWCDQIQMSVITR